MPEPIVELRALRKTFKVLTHRGGLIGAIRNLFSGAGKLVEAVAGIDLEIAPGEFVGCVGPNGAGKSTTIKMLTGILVPTSGAVRVCGLVPHRQRRENARNIGAVFGQRTQLWWDLPPIEAYRLLGKIYRLDPREVTERVAFFGEFFALGDCLETPVRKLSLGEKMRCELAAALLHDPRILFLDEPTIGLDAVAKDQVRTYLRRLNRERGTTILLTSHDLDDIERLCERVLVIDRGRIIHDGTVPGLKRRFGNHRRLIIDFEDAPVLELPAGARVVRVEGARVWVEFDADRLRTPDLVTAILDRHPIHDLMIQENEIEAVIRRIYHESSGGGTE